MLTARCPAFSGDPELKPHSALRGSRRDRRPARLHRVAKVGRPKTSTEIRDLIRQMSMVNPLWGRAPHPRRTATRVLLPSSSKTLLSFTLSARHPDHRTDRRRTMDAEPRERLERSPVRITGAAGLEDDFGSRPLQAPFSGSAAFALMPSSADSLNVFVSGRSIAEGIERSSDTAEQAVPLTLIFFREIDAPFDWRCADRTSRLGCQIPNYVAILCRRFV